MKIFLFHYYFLRLKSPAKPVFQKIIFIHPVTPVLPQCRTADCRGHHSTPRRKPRDLKYERNMTELQLASRPVNHRGGRGEGELTRLPP